MATQRRTTYERFAAMGAIALLLASCVPTMKVREARTGTPASYATSSDSTDAANVKWQTFFTDPELRTLIDSALANNQELNIMLQEIAVAQS